jgi:hypothetical protein
VIVGLVGAVVGHGGWHVSGPVRRGTIAGVSEDRLPPSGPGDVTLVQVLSELATAGYDHDVLVDEDEGLLTCAVCRAQALAREVAVDSLRRVEGASDPADMAVVLGMTCRSCGARGTAILRFGPEASAGEAAVLVALGERSLPVSPPGRGDAA